LPVPGENLEVVRKRAQCAPCLEQLGEKTSESACDNKLAHSDSFAFQVTNP